MTRALLWLVTLTRIALIPVFLLVALRAQELARLGEAAGVARWGVIAVLAMIGVSDVLDGWIARRFGLETQAGAVVDAAADKLAQVTIAAFFVFAQGPAFAPLPLWFFLVVVGRDLLLGGGWAVLRARGARLRVVHRPHGKASSVSVFAVLVWLALGLPRGAVLPLVLLSAAVVVSSTAAYALDGLRQARTYREGSTAVGTGPAGRPIGAGAEP